MLLISPFLPSRTRNSAAIILLILSIATLIAGQAGRQQRSSPTDENLAAKEITIEARRVISEARRSALKIMNDNQRGSVLNEIGAAQAKAGLVDAAVVTANRAYPQSSATLRAIGQQLSHSNDLVKAEKVAQRLKGGGAATVFWVLATRQAEKGKFDEALRITKYIRAPEVRRSALEEIALRQTANSDHAAGRKTLALAKAADPTGNYQPDDPDANDATIAFEQLSRGEVQAAEKTIASFKSPDTAFTVMTSWAEFLSSRGDKAEASGWLERALKMLPAGEEQDFSRYFTLPIQVKLNQSVPAMKAVGSFSADMRPKGYLTIAVVCAEVKDIACVNDALARMELAERSRQAGEEFSDFRVKLMTLNVTAALIANQQLEVASELLTRIEQQLNDEMDTMTIEPGAKLQRVFILIFKGEFAGARALALTMPPNEVSEVNRGTALRTIAVLETKKNGAASVQLWASALTDSEDRAYALLGIAEGLLKYDDPKLRYGVIQVY
jgi:tetratricopeptide (TPR) repeat protein